MLSSSNWVFFCSAERDFPDEEEPLKKFWTIVLLLIAASIALSDQTLRINALAMADSVSVGTIIWITVIAAVGAACWVRRRERTSAPVVNDTFMLIFAAPRSIPPRSGAVVPFKPRGESWVERN